MHVLQDAVQKGYQLSQANSHVISLLDGNTLLPLMN